MNLPFSIAWRYLFTKQREPLEWFTTIVSLLGVAIGVGTMITVVGVMDGLRTKVINDLLESVEQIIIWNKAWSETDPDPALLARIKADPEVAAAEPILYTSAMLSVGGGKDRVQTGVHVYGMDRFEQARIMGIRAKQNGLNEIAPGQIVVCDRLTTRALVGQEAIITSSQRLKKAMYPVFPSAKLSVAGTFTGIDRMVGTRKVFVNTTEWRRLAIQPHGITHFQLQLRDPMRANEVKQRLAGAMPPHTTVYTWMEDFERMFSDMRIMKAGMLLVMLMTVLVAALNIIGTLTLVIIQKTSEIGILKAIGATDKMVARIFMFEGLIVGGTGALIGAAMGLGFLEIVQRFKIQMPAGLFAMKTIPVEIHWLTILLLMIGAMIICTLAATLPARHAARLRPVAALRC